MLAARESEHMAPVAAAVVQSSVVRVVTADSPQQRRTGGQELCGR